MRFKVTFLLLLLILATDIARAQNSTETKQALRAAVEQHNWANVVAELSKLRSSDPSAFRNGNYDYLLGRASELLGDRATAATSYQAVVNRNSHLTGYALWHLARIARATGDLPQEREHLRRLTTFSPSSLLYDAAVVRLGESFFESGDFASAATSAQLGANSKNAANARKSQLLVGRSLKRSSKTTEARDVFVKLLMQMPDASRPDDFALEAARELDELERAAANAQSLSEADRLLRASVYQFNRDFSAARAHYEALIQQSPQSPTVPNATYQIARGLYLERKYTEANTYFQRVIDQFPQSQSARDALGFLGSSYVRLQRTDDAVAAYKALIDRFPDGPNLERRYLNIIDALHEAARYTEALNWVQQARNRFKGEIGATLALFSQLRIHLAQEAWQNAIRDAEELLKLSELGGSAVPGGTSQAEVSFLRTYAVERAGRIDEAINSYLEILDGRNEYYGTRATQRLLALAVNEKTRPLVVNRRNALLATARSGSNESQLEQSRSAAHAALRLTPDANLRSEILTILRNLYNATTAYRLRTFNAVPLDSDSVGSTDSNPHQLLSNELFKLGLYDEAMPEFFAARSSRAPKSSTTLTDEDYSVAIYSYRGTLPNRTVRFAEQFWRSVPADYVIELAPRSLTELLYPVPYRDSVLKHAPSRSVDPRFILSIARQESRYQADAKSVAAARGMMQFIASTASEVASQLKLANFGQENLYDADTAILFGSQYLSSLYQQFPSQHEAVAASYNGGPDNMARWMGRSRSTEPERYVPEIGFAQTKDYVHRVMSNFWTYQKLYDAQLRPVSEVK